MLISFIFIFLYSMPILWLAVQFPSPFEYPVLEVPNEVLEGEQSFAPYRTVVVQANAGLSVTIGKVGGAIANPVVKKQAIQSYL
jgi:hypothetical protein